MVSFDVTSLYRNIPVIDTLNIIKDYVNNDDQFTRKNGYTSRQVSWSSSSGFNNHLVHF